MMVKNFLKYIIFFMAIFMASTYASGEQKSANLISVFAFASFVYDAEYNPNGKYVRPTLVDPMLTEYKVLKHWDGNEKSTSPDHFDVVAVSLSENLPNSVNAVLEIKVLAKIGKLIIDPELNVVDLDKSKKFSTWSDSPIAKVSKNIRINRSKKYESFKINGISLDSIIDTFYSENKWPFEIKVVAKLKCNDYCDSEKEVYFTFDLIPDV